MISKFKICNKCNKKKPATVNYFTKDSHLKSGLRGECKDCEHKHQKKLYAKNKNKFYKRQKKWKQSPKGKISVKNSRLKKCFGIDLEKYQQMLLQQNGVCAICGRPEIATYNGKIRMLAVDHDHKTGEIRGLLCQRCNTVLGSCGDNVALLLQMMSYLNERS